MVKYFQVILSCLLLSLVDLVSLAYLSLLFVAYSLVDQACLAFYPHVYLWKVTNLQKYCFGMSGV